ncbi:MAG: hypothetical protein AAF620_14165 [Bacteroidota bacterium]
MKNLITLTFFLLVGTAIGQYSKKTWELAAGDSLKADLMERPYNHFAESYFEGFTWKQLAHAINNWNKIREFNFSMREKKVSVNESDTVVLLTFINSGYSDITKKYRINDIHFLVLGSQETVIFHRYQHFNQDADLQKAYREMASTIYVVNEWEDRVINDILDWAYEIK